MIYITGDIHGETLRIANMIERFTITPDDTIVILGDVGMNYYGNKHGDRRRKKQLNKHGIKVLCIHGNHEARPESLITYHDEQWNGGTVYVEEEFPNLLFAKDGEVYDLEGCKVITIGGAYSVDKWYRLQCDLHWFPDEQPSDEIKARVEKKLDALGWQVDVVLTHTCPFRYIPREAFLSGVDQSTVDNSTELWLDTIAERLDYKAWYCGHWHINKRIDKMHFVFEDVVSCVKPIRHYLSKGLSPAMAEYYASGRKKIVAVAANNDFTLTITFDNGENRRLDIKPHLRAGTVFEPFMQLENFKRVYIDEQHCICWDIDPNIDSNQVWNNKVDLCPDCCYVDSIPCAEK